MHLLGSRNKYPDCLSIDLEAIAIADTEEFDLYLTFNINQQWEPLLDGRVKFGFKGGKLKLELENVEVLGLTREFKDPTIIVTADSYPHPVWIFRVASKELLLKGAMSRVKLGTIKAIGKPFAVEAVFEVGKEDVSLSDFEGLWRHDISPNKYAILERKIALFLVENRFAPYLSSVWIGSKDFQISPEDEKNGTQTLSRLPELIEKIYESETNNLLELARIANLDPLEDFAGGSFIATELSGIDLGGADLSRTNFRGAILTDADLNETDLSHAKLNGADLSGAYLENSNLSHADLHKASLALGNLIGTNLNNANLTEANLTNTNFTEAKVSEAKFGNNPGLDEETKLSLKERGAIFESE